MLFRHFNLQYAMHREGTHLDTPDAPISAHLEPESGPKSHSMPLPLNQQGTSAMSQLIWLHERHMHMGVQGLFEVGKLYRGYITVDNSPNFIQTLYNHVHVQIAQPNT